MSIVLTFVCSLVFAIIFLVPLGGVIGGWVWGRVGGRLLKVSAAKRSYLLILFAAIPLLWAFLVVGLGLMPSVASVVWAELDHCEVHDDGHPHLCFDHWAVEGLPGWMWLSLIIFLGWGLWQIWRFGSAFRKTKNQLNLLSRVAVYDGEIGANMLECEQPVAFVGGLWRQNIFISRQVWNGLNREDRQVLLDHERAHVARRDNMRKFLARLVSVGHGFRTRAAVLDALTLACEEACDAVAAERAGRGGQLKVAKSLVAIEKQCGVLWQMEGVSQAGEQLEARIYALLASKNKHQEPSNKFIYVVIWGSVAILMLAALPLHHVLESVLGLLLGGHW